MKKSLDKIPEANDDTEIEDNDDFEDTVDAVSVSSGSVHTRDLQLCRNGYRDLNRD